MYMKAQTKHPVLTIPKGPTNGLISSFSHCFWPEREAVLTFGETQPWSRLRLAGIANNIEWQQRQLNWFGIVSQSHNGHINDSDYVRPLCISHTFPLFQWPLRAVDFFEGKNWMGLFKRVGNVFTTLKTQLEIQDI